MSPLEIAASLVTVVNVWLTTKENIWCWPTGLVSAVLYAVVFWQARLYASAGLQVVFFILTLYGWYEWLYGGKDHTELHVIRTPRRWWPALLVIAVVLTAIIGRILVASGGAFPYYDASILGFSIVAQWMMARKLLENWWLWIAVNVMSVAVYGFSSLGATTALYLVLIVLAWKGLVDWRKSVRSASA